MKKYKVEFALVFILALATFLRMWKLGATPSGFYIDEAAIGYNAFSLLKTGRDEFGMLLPSLLRSFTVFGAPVYTYLLVPIYAVMEMSVFSTRLLTAASGVLGVFWIYLLVKRIENKSMALLMAALLSMSAWHLTYSRTTYEVNLGLTFLLISLWCYYLARKRRKEWLIVAGFFAAVSILAYTANRVTVPLIYLALFCWQKKWLLKKNNRGVLIKAGILTLGLLLPMILIMKTPGFSSRLNALSIFATSRNPWGYNPEFQGLSNMVLNHKGLLLLREWMSLYSVFFSPRYLFFLGDPGGRSSFVDIAPLFIWQFPFWLMGIYDYIRNNRLKTELGRLMLAMLVISPLPASITGDPFASIRALPMVIPHLYLVALGLKLVFSKHMKIGVLLGFGLIIFSLLRVYFSFFVINDYFRYKHWNYGTRELVERMAEYPQLPVVLDNSRDELYIEVLFFSKYDPGEYQQNNFEVNPDEYYVNMSRNINKNIGNISTRGIVWSEDIYTDQLLVGDYLAISEDQIKEHCLEKKFEIKGPDRSLLYMGVRTNPEKKRLMDEIMEKMRNNDKARAIPMDCDLLVNKYVE